MLSSACHRLLSHNFVRRSNTFLLTDKSNNMMFSKRLLAASLITGARAFAPTTRAFVARSSALNVAVGDTIPDVTMDETFPPTKISLKELTAGKKIIFVGLPGAFTGT